MPLLSLSAQQRTRMATDLAATMLGDSALNSRTGLVQACHLVPDGQVALGGDARLAPLTRYRVTLPAGADLQPADTLVIAGKGQYLVTSTDTPLTDALSTAGAALRLTDARGAALSVASVDVHRGGSTVLSAVLVHIEPIDPKPFELLQAPEQSQGQTIFDHYVLYTLASTVPDVRARDEMIDAGETDPFTGSAARYYVRRVKRWSGHLEIEADRVASTPTT